MSTAREQAVAAVESADAKIKAATRYACGIDGPWQHTEKKSRVFFSSPDNQNGQLYWGLRALGFSGGGYEAPYKWRIARDGAVVEYVEGDLYVYEEAVLPRSQRAL